MTAPADRVAKSHAAVTWRTEAPHVANLFDRAIRLGRTLLMQVALLAAFAVLEGFTGGHLKGLAMFWCGIIYGGRHLQWRRPVFVVERKG